MEPTINGNVALAFFIGVMVGIGIGYVYGWLHFGGDEGRDEE